eukprot:g1312.t1
MLVCDIATTNDIYQGLVPRFVSKPFKGGAGASGDNDQAVPNQQPERYFHDIRTADDVYLWLRTVFVPSVYKRSSVRNGDPTFCTNRNQCVLHEGPVDGADECHPWLHAGHRNCNRWMGLAANCCEPCENRNVTGGGSYDSPAGEEFCPASKYTVDSAKYDWVFDSRVDDLAAACQVPGGTVDDATGGYGSLTTPAYLVDYNTGLTNVATFCPELLSSPGYGESTDRRDSGGGQVRRRVSEFNQMLFTRMSFKRAKLIKFSNDRLSSSYEFVKAQPTGSVSNPGPDGEDISAFSTRTSYSANLGYGNYGGFLEYLHPEYSLQTAENQIIHMKRENYFDSVKFSSLLVEAIFFNGNEDTFLHLLFSFEMQSNGLIRPTFHVIPFSLNLYSSSALNYFRLFLEIVVLVLFGFFLVDEWSNFADAPRAYLSKSSSWLSIVSLGFTLITVVLYVVLVVSHDYTALMLPLPSLEDGREITEGWIEGITSLQFLSERADAVASAASVNICFIFIRLLTLLANVSPNLGLVLQSLSQGQASLACFLFLFLLLFCGFALSGYLQFGGNVEMFSTWYKALLTCLRMSMGDFDFKLLKNSAQTPFIATVWFILFMAIFFLVLVNMFLSIIVSCYNKQVKYLNEQLEIHGEIDSLKLFVHSAMEKFGKTFTVFERLKMLAALNASSGSYDGQIHRLLRNNDFKNFKLRDHQQVGGAGEWPRGCAQKRAESYPGSVHCMAISSLFLLFFIAITRITRISDSLAYRVSTLADLETAEWYSTSHVREEVSMLRSIEGTRVDGNAHFKSETVMQQTERRVPASGVQSMADVEKWARSAIVEDMYGCAPPTFTDDCGKTKNLFPTREPDGWMLFDGTKLGDFETDSGLNRRYLTAAVGGTGTATGAGAAAGTTTGGGAATSSSSALSVTELRNAIQLSLGYLFDYTATTEVKSPMPAANPVSVTARTPRVREWNLGSVGSDNFFRLKIEPACFSENTATRWKDGYPYVFLQDSAYVDEITTGDSRSCVHFLSSGVGDTVANFTGKASGTLYTLRRRPTDKDSGETGGYYLVGLGKTRTEARRVLDVLKEDGFFSVQTRKLTFDWILYNANLDLFSYNTATFEVLPSGRVSYDLSNTVFPVQHLFSGGTTETLIAARDFNFALMILYVLLVIWVTVGVFISELLVQKQISSELARPFYGFLIDFFDDGYNYINLASAVANVAVIVSWLQFVANPVHEALLDRTGTMTAAAVYAESVVSHHEQSTLDSFAEASVSWNTFVAWSAINSFLLALRILNTYHLPTYQLVRPYFGEVSANVAYKQDEAPMDEIEFIWDDLIEKAKVGTQSFTKSKSSSGDIMPAESAGVRPGWIVSHINDVPLVALLERAKKNAEKNGEPFAGGIWFEHYIREVGSPGSGPCQIQFRSQVGMSGTLMKALVRCIDQIMKFTLVLLMLLLGFAILFHIQFGTRLEAFASPFRSVLSLFRFMIGDVFALQELLAAKYAFTYMLFWVFQVSFFFVLSKQFLAVMVYCWKVHREEKQVYGVFRNIALLCETAVTSNRLLLRLCSCFRSAHSGDGDGEELEPIGEHFWQKWAMLRHLLLMDGLTTSTAVESTEGGEIKAPSGAASLAGGADNASAAGGAPGGEGGGGAGGESAAADATGGGDNGSAAGGAAGSVGGGDQQNGGDAGAAGKPAAHAIGPKKKRIRVPEELRRTGDVDGDMAEELGRVIFPVAHAAGGHGNENLKKGLVELVMEHACAASEQRQKGVRVDIEQKAMAMAGPGGLSESKPRYEEYYTHNLIMRAQGLDAGGSPASDASSAGGYVTGAAGHAGRISAVSAQRAYSGSPAKKSPKKKSSSSDKKKKSASGFLFGGESAKELTNELEELQMPHFLNHAEIHTIDKKLHDEINVSARLLHDSGHDGPLTARIDETADGKLQHKELAILHELLFDCLLSSCEAGQVVAKVRTLFDVSKSPQFEPQNSVEWLAVKKNILKSGKRFELFRQVLEGKTKRKLVNLLVENAERKIDINKEQSLILWKYSEEFATRMREIEQQIETVTVKKTLLTSKLKPLLMGEAGRLFS